MTCCTDRAMWTGFTPGSLALGLGVLIGSGAVANGLLATGMPVASDSLR